MADDDVPDIKFDAESASIQWRELNFEYSEDQQLYHYTDIRGLHGILKSGQLWATHMTYLNDALEIKHGISVICGLIESQAKWLEENPEQTTNPEGVPFVASLYRAMSKGVSGMGTNLESKLAPFVTCLSRSRDQLSQWRGYANGGYALAFDHGALESSLTQVDTDNNPIEPQPPLKLSKVAYLEEQIYEQVKDMVQGRMEGTAEEVKAKGDAKASESARQFFDHIVDIVSTLKHRTFNEEHEYRIVARCHETFYTESALGLIPRTSIRFDKRALSEVIVGPGAFSDLRKASIERWLEEHRSEYGDVQLTPSRVPYREF
ncbi:DUF2971 domain-containing protein [Nocardia wallacei]|uniref:DUF2971 domain-containing protein n=1 Tax=Nocardia wallacei TaxID=480035 RepID=UPI002456225B|nr:DUF2971 domain-containing protein [Nocardia wallacei]